MLGAGQRAFLGEEKAETWKVMGDGQDFVV